MCMPRGCSIAFVSKKFLPLAFEGQCLKKKLEVHSPFLPVREEEEIERGRQPGFHTELTRAYIHYLCPSVPPITFLKTIV